MSRYFLKGLFLIALVIFGTNSYAHNSKGYKIILASYPKFEQAKNTMNLLGDKLTKEDWNLQKQYGYTIVARPSGNVFIIAIEPLENKEVVNRLLARFNQLYPSAYANGYFGPTKGAIVLTPLVGKTPKENAVIEKKPTLVPPLEKSLVRWEWIIPLLGFIGMGIVVTRRGKRTQNNTNSLLETIEEKFNVPPEEVAAEIQKSESVKITQEDIFYTLKKNRFFRMLLDELQKESHAREEQQCLDLIKEMRRYEKKFQSSSIISDMEELAFSKRFRELSELIKDQTSGN